MKNLKGGEYVVENNINPYQNIEENSNKIKTYEIIIASIIIILFVFIIVFGVLILNDKTSIYTKTIDAKVVNVVATDNNDYILTLNYSINNTTYTVTDYYTTKEYNVNDSIKLYYDENNPEKFIFGGKMPKWFAITLITISSILILIVLGWLYMKYTNS